jgi:carbon starvation protein
LYPFLFITIACGAISGFHSLVGSGTTVRQIDKQEDVTFVGYGGMIAEGILALGVILACSAGMNSSDWHANYANWSSASAGGLKAFISGSATFMSGFGIPKQWGAVFIATVAVSFAMTTLDSATRLLRYNIEELAKTLRIKPLQNAYVASLLAVTAIGFFALLKVDGRPAGIILWSLFGTTNQVLAMLTLLVVTVWLWRTGRPIIFALVPMIFMTITVTYAMVVSLVSFWEKNQMALFFVGGFVFVLAVWMIIEGLIIFMRGSSERAAILQLQEASPEVI